ncbi:MAG: PTS transporter subunit EIIC [Erysipelotrichaceae bacterium]|jgi:PTS system cellobiose-specific IIC component|nr:PTS transporter subunit EIIC [Erysipelotrichaceae bacterium]
MKKLISWLELKFVPKLNLVLQRPLIAGLASATQKIFPFILTVCLFLIYNVFRSFFPSLPDLGIICNFAFALLGLIMSYLVAFQCMEKLSHPRYEVNAGLTAIISAIIALSPAFQTDGTLIIDFNRLGASGLLTGMAIGLFVAVIFHLYTKLNLFKNPVSIPDFAVEWINNVVPIFVSIALIILLVFQFKLDFYQGIISFFAPWLSFGQTWWGMVFLMFIPAVCYTLGVSTWTFGAITTPIYLAAMQANINAVAAGLSAQNIVTLETHFSIGLITMGGMGATLALNCLMLCSKSKKLKSMGKICIGPSLFNINEPLVYSVVVLNPVLMLPVWINAFVGPSIVWLIMKFGLLNIPCVLVQIGQVPAPLSTVLFTGDWRGVIWYIVMFAVYLIIWYPFFRVYEKQLLQKELN